MRHILKILVITSLASILLMYLLPTRDIDCSEDLINLEPDKNCYDQQWWWDSAL